ncbi:MAG TPA: NAD(P)/FAD-dependent oxidoreductase [Cyclobacteriaceae bacterium]|nr:NAD(P)/FAD-dependent oxidoreductase [Cyclobacteriaceae bacterium]
MGGVGGMLLNSLDARHVNAAPKESSKPPVTGRPRVVKKIIVAGGGIAGLCCAYELMKMGHEVVVLEAQGRSGGSVLTVHDGLADGLYADFGAEHFHYRGYERYWEYVKEFNLEVLSYPHRTGRLTRVDDKWYDSEELRKIRTHEAKQAGGLSERERKFLSSHMLDELPSLYIEPYLDKFRDSYQPFGIGYDALEKVPITEIYKKEGASRAALELLGGERSSALYVLWQAYITRSRGKTPAPPSTESYRLKGGNQVLPNAFAKRLGYRLQMDCQVLEIEHGATGVTVTYREFGETKKMSADFLACCLRTPVLRSIAITPALPPEKAFVFDNLSFHQSARIIFQSRSRFWLKDNTTINLQFNHPDIGVVWQVADEVDTDRAVMMVKSSGGANPRRALQTFKQLYPGNPANIDVEQVLIKDWSKDTFSPGCERLGFPELGMMSKFWPHLITPVGRIHFAGGHVDNRSWGMEAAINSANRVAREIDQA